MMLIFKHLNDIISNHFKINFNIYKDDFGKITSKATRILDHKNIKVFLITIIKFHYFQNNSP